MNDLLLGFGKQLAELVYKSTASNINTKIEQLKTEKDNAKLRMQYDSLINELIIEREEAIRIASVFRDEVERIQISDDDIEHLQNTISNILELLVKLSPDNKLSKDIIEPIKALISKDTLKAMQLLGFNYKDAIGTPLTNVSADFIESKLGKNSTKKPRK